MARIIVKDLNLGGIADSDYQGAKNSVAEMVGLDIHGEGGIIQLNQKLALDSGAVTFDAFITAKVNCSDGSTYFFTNNGKVYQRTSGATWSLLGTVAPAAGSAGVMDAAEYQGYIYYSMQSRLGRWQIGTAFSTRNDSFATFTNTDASFHPMKVLNLVLYIGDANFVAQVEDGTFSANALDIQAPLRIKSLGRYEDELLMGTYVADNVTQTELVRWNTWSLSYTFSDPIPEVGINAFLDIDNTVVVNAGTKGNLYIYNGSKLELYTSIKGDWSSTNKAVVHPNAVLNFHGIPLFALSKQTGIGVKLGIYSFNRTGRNYPFVLNLEYPISTGNLTNVQIGTITGIGDQFLVSWIDTTTGTVFGVDVLSLTAKQTSGYFITRVTAIDRISKDNFGPVYVPYRSLPANTSIKVYVKKNHAADFTEFHATDEMVTDAERMMRHSTIDVGEANSLQVKVELTTANNDTPEVEMAVVDVNANQ